MAANEQERQQVYKLAEQAQEVTVDAAPRSQPVAFVNEGYTDFLALDILMLKNIVPILSSSP